MNLGLKRVVFTLTLTLAACHSNPAPATPTPVPVTKPVATAPASREPLFVELVSIRRAWVRKYTPEAADPAKAADVLGAELVKKLRNSPDSREAIADAVQQVLGDSAVADPDRPKANTVEREELKHLKRLSASTRAGLVQFTDRAHAGDILDPPAADEEVVVVARVVTSSAAPDSRGAR